MTSHGTNIADLRRLVAADLAASNELSTRIDALRADIADGIPLPAKKVDLMERSNKDMTKDLVARLEEIESLSQKTATDRDMEQALNARLCVCDLHAERLATLRDLEHSARGGGEFLESEVRDKGKVGGKAKREEPEAVFEPLLQPGTPGQEADQQDDEPVEELSAGHANQRYSNEDEDDPWESHVDKSAWPLLYRIIDVDPDTWDQDFKRAADLSLKRLALKHSPKHFPNDPDAPERWKAVMKAYNTLTNPDSKRYYDMHEKVPAELEDFDMARLSLD